MLKKTKKTVTGGLAVVMLAQSTLPTLAATVEAAQNEDQIKDVITELQEKIEQYEDQLESLESNEVETPTDEVVVETPVVDEEVKAEDVTVENTEETKTPTEDAEITEETNDIVVPPTVTPTAPEEEVKNDDATTYDAPANGDFASLSFNNMKKHILDEIDRYYDEVDETSNTVITKLESYSVSVSKVELDAQKVINNSRISAIWGLVNITFNNPLKPQDSKNTLISYHTEITNTKDTWFTNWNTYLNNTFLNDTLNDQLSKFASDVNTYIEKVNADAAEFGVDATQVLADLNALLAFTSSNVNTTGDAVYTVLGDLVNIHRPALDAIKADWSSKVGYVKVLERELAAFVTEVANFENTVAPAYNEINAYVLDGWLNSIDVQYQAVNQAIIDAKTFITQSSALTDEDEAKEALATLRTEVRPNLEANKTSWTKLVDENKKGFGLAQKLKSLQEAVTTFDGQLEQQYAALEGKDGAKQLYDAAKAANKLAQDFIHNNKGKIGTQASIAEGLYLAPLGGFEAAKLAWNTFMNTILSDSLEAIVKDFEAWANKYATTLPLDTITKTLINGLINGLSAEEIINNVIADVTGSIGDAGILELTLLVTRAVLWYEINPEKDEILNKIEDAIVNSEAYRIYQELKAAKEKLEKLIEMIESGQLEADLEAALRAELAKVEALLKDLASQGAAAVKDKVQQIIKEVEELVNKVLNSEEVKQLVALIELIDEALKYIDSEQFQNELNALKAQIEDLLTNIAHKTHEQIVSELKELKAKVDACITTTLQAIYNDLYTQYVALEEKINEELDRLNDCVLTPNDGAFVNQLNADLETLQGQLATIHELIATKNFRDLCEAKKAFVAQMIATLKYIEENVTDPMFCRPAGEGFGPDGDVTPGVDAPADEGFGPDGDVTPGVDAPADEGFGPDGDVTPGVDAPADEGFGPDGNVTPEVKPQPETNTTTTTTPKPSVFPQTGLAAATSFVWGTGFVGLGASILAVLKRRR